MFNKQIGLFYTLSSHSISKFGESSEEGENHEADTNKHNASERDKSVEIADVVISREGLDKSLVLFEKPFSHDIEWCF